MKDSISNRARVARAFWLGAALLCASTSVAQSVSYVPPGTPIDNQGASRYQSEGSDVVQVVQSNTARIFSGELFRFTLNDDHQSLGQPGGTVSFDHLLVNVGNQVDTYQLSVSNIAGDDGDFSGLFVYEDQDQNGLVSSGEPLLFAEGETYTTVSLAPNARLQLVVAAQLPGSAVSGEVYELELTAVSVADDSLVDVDTDTVEVGDNVQINLSKASSQSCASPIEPGSSFTYTIGFTSTGLEAPAERDVNVEGVLTSGVLIEDSLPYGVSLVVGQSISVAPMQTDVLIQLYGETQDQPWTRYENWDGEGVVSRVGFLTPSEYYASNRSGQMVFEVELVRSATANTLLTNSVMIDLDGDRTGEFVSNQVCNTVQGPEALIRFLRPSDDLYLGQTAPDFEDDEDFVDTANYRINNGISTYSPTIDGVYIEVESTTLSGNTYEILQDGRRLLIVDVLSQLTQESARVALYETFPGSGVYRSIRPLVLSDSSGNGDVCPIEILETLENPDAEGHFPVLSEDYEGEVSSECTLHALPDDVLEVSIYDDGVGRILEDAAIVDPFGIVFDSVTLQPVPGAQVVVCSVGATAVAQDDGIENDLCGDFGEQAIDPFQFFAGNTVPLDIEVTGDDGFYQYPFMLPGDFFMFVIPPGGYRFPSLRDPAIFPDFDVIEASYGRDGFSGAEAGVFTLDAINNLIVVDFPLDPVEIELAISSTCEAPGEVLEADERYSYTLSYANTGNLAPPTRTISVDGADVSGVLVEDFLPFDKILDSVQPISPTPDGSQVILQLVEQMGSGEWISFANWNGEDVVASLAILIDASDFGPGVSGSYSFYARTSATLTDQTTIVNRIGVDLDGDGEQEFVSNISECVATGPDSQIRFIAPDYSLQANGQAPDFYDDDDFIDTALYEVVTNNTTYNATVDGVYVELNSSSIPETYLDDAANAASVLDDGRRQVVVQLSSDLTGDSVQVVVQETAYASGIYRSIRPIVLSETESGNGALCPPDNERQSDPDYVSTPPDECVLRSGQEDELTVSFADPGVNRTLEDLALVDPLGVVFDSQTLAPISGATVQIFNSDGSIAVDPITGSELIAQISDANGQYSYPRLLPGDYYVEISPPDGYSWPSIVGPTDLATSGYTVYDASYGEDGFDGLTNSGVFTLTEDFPLFVIDFPVDPGVFNGVLLIEKEALSDSVEVGGLVEYQLSVINVGDARVDDVVIYDSLPYGFGYIDETLRVDGVTVDDPEGAPGPDIQISVGSLSVGSEVTVAYVLQATAGAVDGDGINVAQAQGTNLGDGSAVVSNTARAQVEIERTGVLADTAVLFGKVYVDSDCNNLQNDAEWPIGGVKLYLEDGTFAITDENGQYSIYGLDAGNHIVKVDPLTVPVGLVLKPIDNRHAANPGSRFADMVSGEFHRADFAAACPSAEDAERLFDEIAARNRSMQGSDWMLDEASRFDPTQNQQLSDEARAQQTGGDLSSGVVSIQRNQTELRESLERSSGVLVGNQQISESLDEEQTLIEAMAVDFPDVEQVVAEITNAQAVAGTWLWPTDGVSWMGRFVAVVRAGLVPTLFVNDVEVPNSKIGEQFSNSRESAQVIAWYGVDLDEGVNQVEVRTTDPFGNVRVMASGEFYNPGAPVRMTLTADSNKLPADGGRSVLPITINIVDKNGHPARGIDFLTIQTTDGSFVEPDIQSVVTGHQVRIINGETTINLRSSEFTGETLVRVSNDVYDEELTVSFIASQRSILAAGIASAETGVCTINSEGAGPTGLGCSDATLQTRLAMFLKGQIKGGYFLTLSYDSEKVSEDDLLRDVNQNEVYPILGDNSVRGYEAQSRSKLYARLEYETSHIAWGDFVTDVGNDYRDLARVSRTLTGANAVYDNERVAVEAFAANVEETNKTVEIPGNGTAMFFQLPDSTIVSNSEVIELITRDRDADALVIESVTLQRFLDYTIDYLTGDIRFTSVIPTFDSDLNPVSIRASYDVEGNGTEYLVAGARGTLDVSDQIVVGASYTMDENPDEGYQVGGGFIEVAPTDNTRIFVSGATMNHEDDSSPTGSALYAEVEVTWDNGGRGVATWGYAQSGFTNSGSGVSADSEDLLLNYTQPLTEALSLDAEILTAKTLSSGDKSETARLSFDYQVAGWTLTLGGRQINQETEDEIDEATTVIAGAGRSFQIFGRKLQLQADYEREAGGSNRQRWSTSANMQLFDALNAYATFEQINSLSGISTISSTTDQINASFGLETTLFANTALYNEYSMRGVSDGKELEAATGVRGDYTVREGLTVSPSVELINSLAGASAEDSFAISLGLTDISHENSRKTLRIEGRFSDSQDYYGMDASYVARINLDWSSFIREDLSYVQADGSEATLEHLLTIGLTRRPRTDNSWHSLYMYQWGEDRAEGTLSDRSVHLLSTHQNWQPHDRWVVSGRLGAKYEDQPLLETSFSSLTAVMDARLIWDFTRRFDLDVHGGVLGTNGFDEARYSLGLGVNFLMNENFRIGVGYNLIGFEEGDLDPEGFNQHGFYLRADYKFDEAAFGWLESDTNAAAKRENEE